MPSQLPGQMTVPTRDEIAQRAIQDFLSRVPDGDARDPQVIADAYVLADALLPAYANQRTLGSNGVLEDATGDAAKQWGAREGVGDPLGANGSSGFGVISASVGGAVYPNGAIAVDQDTGLQYQLVITTGESSKRYNDGDQVTLEAVDTGPQTNIAGGKQLKWLSPPSGSGPVVTVFTNSDGTGLVGGSDGETDSQYVLRIRDRKADGGSSGSDADYRKAAKQTPGVRVLEAFTYPAIVSTGTTALAFLVPPLQPGGSRIPTEAQRQLVEAYVTDQEPGDDGPWFPVHLEQQVDIAYQLSWISETAGWADVTPWPRYYAISGTPGGVVVQSAASATSFILSASSYTGILQPAVGNTIAFFNQAGGAFVKKRIGAISGTGPWTITVDTTTTTASDTSYVPVVGQRAMPWSDSLPTLLTTVFALFDGLGPGEMVASFYDTGRRQRRQPQPPREWPNVLTTKALENAIDIDQVLDGKIIEGANTTTTVGTPGVLVYVMRLRTVNVFPL